MANTTVYNITRANNVDFIQLFFVAWAERNQRGAMDYPVRVLKGIKCGLHIEDIDILPCYMFCNVLEKRDIAVFPFQGYKGLLRLQQLTNHKAAQKPVGTGYHDHGYKLLLSNPKVRAFSKERDRRA